MISSLPILKIPWIFNEKVNSDLGRKPDESPKWKHRQHIPVLDGVRGLAILMVLITHFSSGPAQDYVLLSRRMMAYDRIQTGGWMGVDLFFVLSGFLITGILFDAKGKPNYFRNFYARRSLRIFPLYYLTLLVVGLVGMRSIMQPTDKWPPPSQFYVWVYCTNILMSLRDSFCFGRISHFWSLAVEEHFYLLWPLLVLYLNRKWLAVTSVGLVILAPTLRYLFVLNKLGNLAPYTFTFCRVDALAMGALVAMILDKDIIKSSKRLLRISALVAGACFLGLLVVLARIKGLWFYTPPLNTIGYSVVDLMFAALLVVAIACQQNSIGAFLQLRWLRLFGKYSYGIYVLHSPLLPIFNMAFPLEGIRHIVGSYVLATLIHVIGSSLLALLLGFLSYHVLEQPFLRLKTYFPRAGT